MQLFAFDKKNRIVLADQAEQRADYFCRECGSVLRVRGGRHKKRHFFHLSSQSVCRQSQKSEAHLQVQYFLEKLFGADCVLEKQFPEIGRIADVVWESEKIIFEVQCSMISKEEVEQRNKDYHSIGYQVIWVFHERKFNRFKVTAAEAFLRNSPHYYTDIDNFGRGEIYDQIDSIKGGLRRVFKKLFGIKLNRIRRNSETSNLRKEWPVYFKDDLVDRCLNQDEKIIELLDEVSKYEKSYSKQFFSPFTTIFFSFFHFVIVRPYRLFFQIFLEKACQ